MGETSQLTKCACEGEVEFARNIKAASFVRFGDRRSASIPDGRMRSNCDQHFATREEAAPRRRRKKGGWSTSSFSSSRHGETDMAGLEERMRSEGRGL